MPAPFLAQHVAFMLGGPLGIDIVTGGVTYRGLFDQVGGIVEDDQGERLTVDRTILVAEATPRLSINQSITADGVACVVRTPPLPVEDGGLVRYGLALASPGAGTV